MLNNSKFSVRKTHTLSRADSSGCFLPMQLARLKWGQFRSISSGGAQRWRPGRQQRELRGGRSPMAAARLGAGRPAGARHPRRASGLVHAQGGTALPLGCWNTWFLTRLSGADTARAHHEPVQSHAIGDGAAKVCAPRMPFAAHPPGGSGTASTLWVQAWVEIHQTEKNP